MNSLDQWLKSMFSYNSCAQTFWVVVWMSDSGLVYGLDPGPVINLWAQFLWGVRAVWCMALALCTLYWTYGPRPVHQTDLVHRAMTSGSSVWKLGSRGMMAVLISGPVGSPTIQMTWLHRLEVEYH